MFGLHKPRTKLGIFMDEHSISQKYIIEETLLNKNTLTRLCTLSDENPKPSKATKKLIYDAIKKKVPDVKMSDLF
ncbi:XRE family transcriptional regulator [Brevibacillus agri BAB-2500]|nr:XRE family transcriptional regulator [Brevibacillus agri BAB-2500]